MNGAGEPRKRAITWALMSLIRIYRSITVGRMPRCRFIPSCSEYASEALGSLGSRRALPLIFRRLARCRPRGGYGYDPVPGTGPEPGARQRRSPA